MRRQLDFIPARVGDFYQDKPSLNLNTVLNYFIAKPATFHPSAIILQEVKFPDVSFWQGEIDYKIMCMQTQAIIIRAGQNLWADSRFEQNYLEAKKCAMKVGVYWFYDGRASPSDQARLLANLLSDKKLEMEVYIDWEINYGGQHEGLRNVVAMMELIENAGLNIKGVGLYTGYYFFRSNSNPIANASQYNYLKQRPLWLAWYINNSENVLIPAPWLHLTHWQWGTPTVDWGQETKEIDMNYFNGTKQEFELRYGETGEPEPMTDYVELKSSSNSNHSIRRPTAYPQVPHIIGTTFASLVAGTVARVEPSDFYLYVSDIIYNGVKQAHAGDKWWKAMIGDEVGWVAEIHKSVRYLDATLIHVNPPPDVVLPTLTIEVSDTEGLYTSVTVELKPK